MGVRIASVSTNTIITASPANAVDAVLATTGAISLIQDNALVLIHWFLTIITGAGATNYNVRLRRGTTAAGTLLNQNTSNNVVASNTISFAGSYFDTPGVVAGVQYTLTGIVTGGAAGVTVADVALIAYVL